MRALVVMAMLATPALAEPVSSPPHCRDRNGVFPAAAEGAAAFRRLDRLPPAAHVLTVFRAVDGCPAPVVVRYGIGVRPRAGR